MLSADSSHSRRSIEIELPAGLARCAGDRVHELRVLAADEVAEAVGAKRLQRLLVEEERVRDNDDRATRPIRRRARAIGCRAIRAAPWRSASPPTRCPGES